MSGRSVTAVLPGGGGRGRRACRRRPWPGGGRRAGGQPAAGLCPGVDGAGQGDEGPVTRRPQGPPVGGPADDGGQPLEGVGEGVGRVPVGDALDQHGAADLDPAGGADALGLLGQVGRVLHFGGPGAEAVEGGQDGPDGLRRGAHGDRARRRRRLPSALSSSPPSYMARCECQMIGGLTFRRSGAMLPGCVSTAAPWTSFLRKASTPISVLVSPPEPGRVRGFFRFRTRIARRAHHPRTTERQSHE